MKDPTDSIDTTLRNSIGGFRSATGERLNQFAVNYRLLQRVIELEEAQFRMIGALQSLGADCCDRCELWFKEEDVIRCCDRCYCGGCFQTLDDFISEDDDQETFDRILKELTALAARNPKWKDRLPKDKRWIAEYNRIAA